MKDLLSKTKERIKSSSGIIKDRWETGKPHHPLSELIINAMSAIDNKFYGFYFDIKTGGDGDNGETMMYILDAYFEELSGAEDVRKILDEITN